MSNLRLLQFTIIAVCLLLYWPSTGFDFAYDDLWQIARDPVVTASDTGLASILRPFTEATPPGNLYRPVTVLSYRLTYLLFGLNPFAFHLSNIILYAVICALLPLFLRPFVASDRLLAAAALIFALHPVHVEAVANVVGRAEQLAALFGMASAIAARCSVNSTGVLRLAAVAAAALTLLLACLCKESALTFTLLVPLYALAHQSVRIRLPLVLLPAACSCAAALLARYAVLGPLFAGHEAQLLGPIAENPIAHLSPQARILPALAILGDYIRLLICPLGLTADYSLMPDEFMRRLLTVSGALRSLLPPIFIWLLFTQRREAHVILGIWFLVSFALTLNIVSPLGTIMGERLAFTPSIGFIPFVLCALERATQARRIESLGRPLLFVYIALLAALSVQRIPVWRDNRTLFEQTASDAPLSPKAMFNYGIELQKAGELRQAEKLMRRALELNSEHLPAARSLADIYLARGELGRVEYWYRYILQRSPEDSRVQAALQALEKLKR